jgi:hypothetical protein
MHAMKPMWRLQSLCFLFLATTSRSPAGLSPPRRRRPWWPATGGMGVSHVLDVGFLFCFFSLANKRAAVGSRFDSSLLPILLSLGHDCVVDWSSFKAESHAGTPWPSPWRGIGSVVIAHTPLPPFLFFNKSSLVTKDDPIYVVDLGIGSLHIAAISPGVPQQGTCDGGCHLASAPNGRKVALLSHGMALLQPPGWRPQPEVHVSVQHPLVPKWRVPGDVMVAGGKVLDLVERTKELTTFLVLVLGSYMQCSRLR